MKRILSLFIPCTLFAITDSGQLEEKETEESKFDTRQCIFSNVEFLYWTVEEGALDYAVLMNRQGPSQPAFAIGKYRTAHYDWNPGFRVSAGFYRAAHYWEVFGQYTWYYSTGHNHTNAPEEADRFLNATWNEMTPVPLASATSRLNLHYNVGDGLVTRVFDPNPHLRMRWVGGLTTAYITQTWKVNYIGADGTYDHLKNKWRFVGGGLRLGIAIDWFWTGRIYFTGKASIASLVGRYRNHARQFTNAADFDPSIPIRSVTYDSARFAFHYQISLGPSYQRTFRTPRTWDFELFAGYELNCWFNLQETYRSSLSAVDAAKETNLQTGVLGFQGLNIRASIRY